MARPSMLGRLWWMLIAYFALTFLAVLVFFGLMAMTGRIGPDTLGQTLSVLRGEAETLPREEMQRYRELLEAAEERAAAEAEEIGSSLIHAEAMEARARETEMLRQEVELMQRRLEEERRKNEEMRTRIESLKEETTAQRKLLEEEKEKKVVVRQSERTQRLMDTFKNMDAADISAVLTDMAKADAEYVVRLFELMQPRLVAEVLTEMPNDTRQTLLPIMHNTYASMPPEQVVNEWERTDASPRQIKEYLRSMSTTQAIRVLRRLDRNTREDVWELIAPTQTEAR
ncbi:MAG: hypothetical protein ACOCX4_08030 [Planctomycetota bacterium]